MSQYEVPLMCVSWRRTDLKHQAIRALKLNHLVHQENILLSHQHKYIRDDRGKTCSVVPREKVEGDVRVLGKCDKGLAE